MNDEIPMPVPYAPEITDAQWTNATKTLIRATIDGVECFVPIDEGNRHYRAILASGITIADPEVTNDSEPKK